MKQLFYIQISNDTGAITKAVDATTANYANQAGWYLVAINSDHASDFKSNYARYKYDRNARAVIYPDANPTDKLPNIDVTGGVTSLKNVKADKASLNADSTSASNGISKNSSNVASLSASANSDYVHNSQAINAVAGDPASLTALSNFVSANGSNINILGKTVGSLSNLDSTKADKASLNQTNGSVSANNSNIAKNSAAISAANASADSNFATKSALNQTNTSLVPSLANSANSEAKSEGSSYANLKASSLSDNIALNSTTEDAYFNQAEKDASNSADTVQSEVSELHSEVSDILNR